MQDQSKKLDVVEGKRVFEVLRERLPQIEVPIACGVGVVNWIHGVTLANPQFYIEAGRAQFEPPEEIHRAMGAMTVFVCKEAEKGSSGCLTYSILGTKLMVAVLWLAGPNGNRYNTRCLQSRPCDQGLFQELYEHSVRSSESLVRDENNFRLVACMSESGKSVLVVECSSLISHFTKSKIYPIGAEMRHECEKIVSEFKGDSCCLIGIENDMVGNHLGHPQMLDETGKVLIEPIDVVEPGMGTPTLFCKREFALRGTSGCLSYDIGDTESMVVVKWLVPTKDGTGENRFNAHITARRALSPEMAKEMEGDWVTVRQGKMVRNEQAFKIEATMTEDEKAMLFIKVSGSS